MFWGSKTAKKVDSLEKTVVYLIDSQKEYQDMVIQLCTEMGKAQAQVLSLLLDKEEKKNGAPATTKDFLQLIAKLANEDINYAAINNMEGNLAQQVDFLMMTLSTIEQTVKKELSK